MTSIRQVAVVGAGTMGHAIALEFALRGYPVRLTDDTAERVQAGLERVQRTSVILVEQGIASAAEVAAALGRLSGTAVLAEAVEGADYVVEAVYENLPVKQAVYERLDELCPPTTVLASNTSSLLPSEMAARMRQHPERMLVTHYWNPPHLIPLVEVVPHAGTDPAVVEIARALLLSNGKRPVVMAREVAGFVGNRLQIALLREALHLVEQGYVTIEDIDTVVSTSFGRRIGVLGFLRMVDMNGLDVWQAISTYLYPKISAAQEASPLLAERVARGELGLKTGQGFYPWTDAQADDYLHRRDAELIRWLRVDRGEA